MWTMCVFAWSSNLYAVLAVLMVGLAEDEGRLEEAPRPFHAFHVANAAQLSSQRVLAAGYGRTPTTVAITELQSEAVNA